MEQQQVQPQQQYVQMPQNLNTCYIPLPVSELQRVGICFVTEGPAGLSIDCNVPIPSSFNLDGYRNQPFSLSTPADRNTGLSVMNPLIPGFNSPSLYESACCDQEPEIYTQPGKAFNNFKQSGQTNCPTTEKYSFSSPLRTSFINSNSSRNPQNQNPNQPIPHFCQMQAISLQPVQLSQQLMQHKQVERDQPHPQNQQSVRMMRLDIPCQLANTSSSQKPSCVLQLVAPVQSKNPTVQLPHLVAPLPFTSPGAPPPKAYPEFTSGNSPTVYRPTHSMPVDASKRSTFQKVNSNSNNFAQTNRNCLTMPSQVSGNATMNVNAHSNGNRSSNGYGNMPGYMMHGCGNGWRCPRCCSQCCWHSESRLGAGRSPKF